MAKNKLLKFEPDAITGLDTEAMRVYHIPDNWTRLAQGEKDSQTLDTDATATANDVDNFDSVRAGGEVAEGAGGAGGPASIMKIEPKSQ